MHMKQTYFQFRQFVVQQDKTPMKVCTDACLFGAWVRRQLPVAGRLRGLDIGTGTGLLSLMLVQEADIDMVAIDVDEAAAKQAKENVAASRFASRIDVYQQDAIGFSPPGKFDVVICNPPFFKQSLVPADNGKHLAKHEARLDLSRLVRLVRPWLNDGGLFYLLLPFYRSGELEILTEKTGWHITKKLKMKQTAAHDFFRVAYALGVVPAGMEEEALVIRQDDGLYTAPFLQYLEPYYLPQHYLRNMK